MMIWIFVCSIGALGLIRLHWVMFGPPARPPIRQPEGSDE